VALNLHAEVRGAITSVNPDTPILYLASTGNSVDNAGRVTPGYATGANLLGQVQPLSARDLEKINYLNLEGVLRSVHMFGNTQGVVRVDAKGGDLLQFPEVAGSTVQNWLVVNVMETWGVVGQGGWCRVIVQLQTDTP
jgi:hypothetical protein